ncbi:MAG TPA: dihydropteroate synthase [Candidatus Angelobacter sp.]|nr:dihydropteroate synthase [Candidatus Angelobacter sp.]
MPRPSYTWRLRNRELKLGARTLVMGILNVTPDSFFDGGKFYSDGGKFLSHDHAVGHGLQMLNEGADILDIGGESTRPGARVGESGISPQEELKRVLPVIEDILRERPETLISVDTYKAEVARTAVNAGAEIINDVSALRWDLAMAATLADFGCGVILMHTRGRPEEWRTLPASPDIVAEVKSDLRSWSQAAVAAGIARDRIVIDPGFGFGKNFEQNYPLLARLGELHDLGWPLLSGTSRKSFIGRTLAHDGEDIPPEERLNGTLATVTASVLQGAHIVRVHDVKPGVEAVKVADEIIQEGRKT